MPGVEIFDRYATDYEARFERNRNIFLSEAGLLKSMIPEGLTGFEIGIGSGRFAGSLGILSGLEPSVSIAKLAEERGLKVVRAKGEKIPVSDGAYDFVLIVTTICFLDDPELALKEAYRIIKPGGFIVVGFVPSESPMGLDYQAKKDVSKFYQQARFFRVREVQELLEKAEFQGVESGQTPFEPGNGSIQPFEKGHDRGSFVALKSYKTVSCQ